MELKINAGVVIVIIFQMVIIEVKFKMVKYIKDEKWSKYFI